MEKYPPRGFHCVAISTDPFLFFHTPGWHEPWGRVLCLSIKKRTLPRIKNVKHTAPVHGMCILAAHGEAVDTVVVSDMNEMCTEYYVLIKLLSYRRRQHVLFVSSTLPPMSFLESLFSRVEVWTPPLSSGVDEARVSYVVENHMDIPLSFHIQRHWIEEWLALHRHHFPRIVFYVPSRYQCEIMKLSLEITYPYCKSVVSENNNAQPPRLPVSAENVFVLTTGARGDHDIPDGIADLVVDFGFYQRKCRGGYSDVVPCCQTTMARRKRKARGGGLVLRLMSEQHFLNRPCFIDSCEEWVPWGAVFLASLELPYREILGIDHEPLEGWGLDLEHSTKKRLKTLLQHPFSIRAHLMLERCRKKKKLSENYRLWITLAITLINWFDHHPRFLVSKRSFHELQCIYGNDDELWIHMRIAILLLSGSPLLHVDFIHAEATAKTFCYHFQNALYRVYGKRGTPPTLPLTMTTADMDAVRDFLLTDARVERFFPAHKESGSYYNSISFLHSFPGPTQHSVLVLNILRSSDEWNRRITLWTFMPSRVVCFQTSLRGYLQHAVQQQETKQRHVSWYRERVIRYFQQVLVHASWC